MQHLKRINCILLLCLVLLTGLLTREVSATELSVGTNLEDFTYTIDENAGTVTLTGYIGSNTAVTVAANYGLNDSVYRTLLDTTVFRQNKDITSVIILEGVAVSGDSMAEMFYGCSALRILDLRGLDTAGVTDFYRLFSECKNLVEVDVTGWDTSSVANMGFLFDCCDSLTTIIGYESWDTGSVWNIRKAFNQTASISTVDLSSWDLSRVTNSGWCFQFCNASRILLPENLSVMGAGFLNHAKNYAGISMTIPRGVRKIGYAHTLYDFGTNAFAEFAVAEDNPNYQTLDGILYSMDGTELLAVPRSKTFENGIFEIPNSVTFLGELCFSRNYNIETIVLPDPFIVEYVPRNDDRYILEDGHGGNDTGNLNAGNNLSIAIYCYTGITSYDVRESNTNYEAVDGILYSENMTALVAIPSRYDREIVIPEGVTTWLSEAAWAENRDVVDNLMIKCPGVSIPASMTDIAQDQIDKLNRLVSRSSAPFTIRVAPESTSYYVDADTGCLMAYEKLEILSQPAGYTGYLGQEMNVTIAAKGEDPTYQWYFRDNSMDTFQMSSCRTNAYTFPMTRDSIGREIYCVVTDRFGKTVRSETVTYTRVPREELAVTVQPTGYSGKLNEELQVEIGASGEELTYQWYWRERNMKEFRKSSCQTDTYEIKLIGWRVGRQIYCVITDFTGNQIQTDVVALERIP